jgi:energy-coupling factor transporter ATP-binding protein EcfA2
LGATSKYLQHLEYQHRSFDVKGLTTQGIYILDLNQVFVELRVEPNTLHRISAGVVYATSQSLIHGTHSIWDFLMFQPIGSQNLALIGSPGSGKTTLLKSMALALSGKRHRGGPDLPNKLPVFLYIRDHAGAITSSPSYSLIDAIILSLAKEQRPELPPPNWFNSQLKKGNCLVMLDGLDEVADAESRMIVVDWVEKQMRAYGNNRFIITSRPLGYRSNPLSEVTILEVQPFNTQQVRRFVANWYRANEIMSHQRDDPGVRWEAQQGANDLLRRIYTTQALTELAVNPLLLTMIATVHRFRSSLPGRRVELYGEICEVFLGKRQGARGIEIDLTPAQKQRVLKPLAYHMMCNELREISETEAIAVIEEPLSLVSQKYSGQEFLREVEGSSGILMQREEGIYSFAHLTFQEYLASVHMKENGLTYNLKERVGSSWWHETLRLYAAQSDASPIISACLSGQDTSIDALTLALLCRNEALEIKPDISQQLEEMLAHGLSHAAMESRRIISETLLNLRLRGMLRMDENKYVDDSLITNAEYQLFLDDMREGDEYCQPDHWLSYQFPDGEGRMPVLGVRPADAVAFCGWLTQRDKSGWSYRLLTEDESQSIESQETGRSGKTAPLGYWIRSKDGFKDNLDEIIQGSSSGQNFFKTANADSYISGTAESQKEIGVNTRPEVSNLNLDMIIDIMVLRRSELVFHIEFKPDLDSTNEPASDVDLDLDLVRTIVRDLERAIVSDFDLARAIANALTIYGYLDLARDLDRHLARAKTLASDLARASDFARHNISNLVRDSDVDIDYDVARTLTRASYLDLASDLASDIVSDIVSSLASIRGLVSNSDGIFNYLTNALDRIRALASVLDRNRANVSVLDPQLDCDLNSARYLHAQIGSNFFKLCWWAAVSRVPQSSALEKRDRLIAINRCLRYCAFASGNLGLYSRLMILERRILGQQLTSEGIRIIRERKESVH